MVTLSRLVQTGSALRVTTTVALIFILRSGPLHAGIITFTDRVSWNAAVGAPDFVEDFNSYSSDVSFVDAPFDVGPFTLSHIGPVNDEVSLSRNRIDAASFSSGQSVDGTTRLDLIVNRFSQGVKVCVSFDTPIYAFGFDFDSINLPDFSVELVSGAGTTSLSPTSASGFFGFVTSPAEKITEIRFSGSANDGFVVDNVAGAFIPEPSTFLLCLPICGVSLMRYRRLRRKRE